jgi:hypothetical protein
VESNVFWQSSPTRVAVDNGLHAMMINGGRDHTVRGNLILGNFTAGVSSALLYAITSSAHRPREKDIFCLEQVWLNDIGLQGFASKVAAGEFVAMHDVRYDQPPWSTHYPRLARMHDYLSLPLLGNCSRDPLCPGAPFGNRFVSNVAVNQSSKLVSLATDVSVIEVDGRWQAVGFDPAMFVLPREKDFDPRNVDTGQTEADKNWQASWEDPGWQALALDPMRGPCLRIKPDAKLFREAPGFMPIPMERIGTPAFRARLPKC